MNNDQHIQDYLQEELNLEERKSFEDLLQKDKALKKDLEDHKAILKAFKINEAERLKSRLIAHENFNERKSIRRIKPLFYAIAASIVVLIGVSFYFNFFIQDLYKQHFEVYPNVYQPIVRGSAEEGTKAFMYYENEDYEKASKFFKNQLEDDNNPSVRFYLALSYLNNDQAEQALIELKKLKNTDFEFSAEVLWYYALAELKIGNETNSKRLLEQLKGNYPEYQTEDVHNLIDELD